MPQGSTLQVEGYQALMKALAACDRKTKRDLRAILRATGGAVQRDAAGKVVSEQPEDQKTAAGYRVVVRQRGVAVEQSLRRTTGLHPEWGGWQMRHGLVPALVENAPDTARRMTEALELLARRFNQPRPGV